MTSLTTPTAVYITARGYGYTSPAMLSSLLHKGGLDITTVYLLVDGLRDLYPNLRHTTQHALNGFATKTIPVRVADIRQLVNRTHNSSAVRRIHEYRKLFAFAHARRVGEPAALVLDTDMLVLGRICLPDTPVAVGTYLGGYVSTGFVYGRSDSGFDPQPRFVKPTAPALCELTDNYHIRAALEGRVARLTASAYNVVDLANLPPSLHNFQGVVHFGGKVKPWNLHDVPDHDGVRELLRLWRFYGGA